MICVSHFVELSVRRWFRWGLTIVLFCGGLWVGPSQLYAQSSSQAPHQPSPKSGAASPGKPSASQPGQDPLSALLQQAKAAIDKNDFAAAIDPLQRVLAQRPDDPFTHFQLGFAHAGLKRWEEAKVEFSRAIALDPKMAAAHMNLGLVLLNGDHGDPQAAAESFRRAAELQPTESRPRFLAGSALELAGKFSDAAEQYRSALLLAPKDGEYQIALGRVLLRSDHAAESEAHFRDAVAARGNSAPAHLGLAHALLAQKKYDAGADELGEYLKLNPTDRAERIERVSDLMESNRLNEALAELDRLDADSPPEPRNLKLRAGIYLQQKQWQTAKATLHQAIALSPQDPDFPAWLGDAEIQLHDYPAAVTALNQAIAMNPKSPEPVRDIANALFLAGDYVSTLRAMDQLARMEEPKPGSWFVRGICYDKLSQKAQAIDAYQKFLDLDKGQNDTQDFQATHRILTLQRELGQSPRKKKN